jgi:Peptidase inhibitor family I36
MNKLILTLALTGCVPQPEGIEAENAAVLSETITLYSGRGYTGFQVTLDGDVDDLGTLSFDNNTVSLQNNTSSTITLHSDVGQKGRCQLLLPGMWLADMTQFDMGPNRLSSIEFGANCQTGTSTVRVRNNVSELIRFRTNPNTLIGDWTSPFSVGFERSQTFSRNAYTVRVDVIGWSNFQWHPICSVGKVADELLLGDISFTANDWGTCPAN